MVVYITDILHLYKNVKFIQNKKDLTCCVILQIKSFFPL